MEDYRWAVLRGRMKPWQFQIFNLLFIVLYQNALLVLITLPAYIAWQHPAPFGGVGRALRRAVRGVPRRRVRRGPAAVELPPGQEGRGRPPRARLRHDRAVRLQPPPELLLRAGAVVGVLRDRRGGGRGIRSRRLGRRRSTGRSSVRRCSPCCSSARRSSPSRSPRRSTPAYADYQRRTSMLVPLPRRRRPERGARRAPEAGVSRRGARPTRAGSTPRTSTRRSPDPPTARRSRPGRRRTRTGRRRGAR